MKHSSIREEKSSETSTTDRFGYWNTTFRCESYRTRTMYYILHTYIYILCTPHDIHLVRFISSNERNFKNYKYRWILRKHSRLRKNNIVVSLYTVNKWASLHARRDSFIASTWTVTKKAMPPSFLLRHFGATRSGPGKKRYPPLATI